MIYVEDFLKCAIQLVKDNLNAELLKIDTERGDFVMKPVDMNNAVIFQSLNNFPVNFDPILFYGVDQVTTDSIESATGDNWEIEFSIIMADPQDQSASYRLLRYQRALKEIFKTNYVKINNMRQKVQVKSLNPISLTLQNNSNEFRAIGIIVETTLFE